MRKINKIFIVIILATVILIRNYYVIASSLNSSQLNFKVRFSGEPQVSNAAKVKAAITDELSATINVNNLTMKENIETVTYIVQNTSTDLSAELSMEANNSNKEYFSLSYNIEKTILKKGEATKVTVIIELIKEPILENEKATIGIQLKATPVQPSEDKEDKPNSPITNIKDYYDKDDTPKTGNSSFIDIFGR